MGWEMKKELLKDNELLMRQYDYERNGNIALDIITTGSNKKVWWICQKGHSFNQEVIKRRDHPYSCPYCSGKKVLEGFNDFKTLFPDIAVEWHPTLNEPLKATMIAAHSNKIVWWKCSKCGYEWKTKVNDRANGKGCSKCATKKRIKSFRENNYLKRGENDLETLRPDLLTEWDFENNADRRPNDYTCSSKEKIWWKCSICGYVWQATISNRANHNSGCPKCMKHERTSFPEQALFYYALKLFPDARNGYKEIFDDGRTELDIYIPTIRTGIEYDGKAWHNNARSIKKTIEKFNTCKKHGIRLIRVAESDAEMDQWSDLLIHREQLTPAGLDKTIKEVLFALSQNSIHVDSERDRKEIMAQYITVLRNRSILAKYPEAVKDWDIEKNKGITADMVSASSNDGYWWRCALGHSFIMAPANKLLGKHGCPICSNHKVLSGFNDMATRYPQIALDWDYDRNAPITPNEVMPGSVKKYWWLCKQGHSYQATPNGRTANHNGCPYCSGASTLEGFNDLDTTNPEVSALWDYEKNVMSPKMISAGSSKKIWFKCERGHNWLNSVNAQVRSNHCPVCENRVALQGYNDLSVTHPQLLKDWDFERNETISPYKLTYRNTLRVWWHCSVCGERWKSRIDLRARGVGCPKCGYTTKMQATRASNNKKSQYNLVSCFPEIASEWDYNKNEGLDPSEISPGSKHKVWWICPKGHSYQAWLNDRTGKRKTGCPYCAGKRRNDNITISNPELVLEWDYEKNGALRPDMFTRASSQKVWWKCSNNHSFCSQIKSRAYRGTGCPFCSKRKIKHK